MIWSADASSFLPRKTLATIKVPCRKGQEASEEEEEEEEVGSMRGAAEMPLEEEGKGSFAGLIGSLTGGKKT